MQLLSLIVLLLPPMVACWSNGAPPHDCSDLGNDVSLPSGVYTLYPYRFSDGIPAYCDMDTDRGGWTVILRREDGELNFFRHWESYRNGFGNLAGEHWLGLENLYQLTKEGSYELRVDLEDFEGNCVYAEYSSFYIDDQSGGYALHVSGFKDGGAGDSLSDHDGMMFSTFNKDQDNSTSNCAERFIGAWWYNSCYSSNPTGVYQWGTCLERFCRGVVWSHWKGYSYSVRAATMMFRAVSS
ncbi:unnamed protein product [Ophioblennius macclurei]